MRKKLRPSVLAIMTVIVMVGLSFVPTEGNQAVQTAHANHHQSYLLKLSRQNGTWRLNHAQSGNLTVAVPPRTGIHLVSTLDAKAVEFVQLTPIHHQMGKQPLVFSSDSEKSGVEIDGNQIGLGKYLCKVKVAGEIRPITFELAVSPAVPQPKLVTS